ncbi:SDR family oxidoreductase [Mobilicoccus caccae]|uniref:NAD-dependent dehydratase n=1 Tax=Mobilicoccus caccae TaxID=1859295 RepID=A0ABQ6IQ63_9MICO|nr:SDR family oxidoreductase [Mobilicoccus caccae]GMA39241.1 NAD-dependent dehydratase [Mobilicoccus caccae]
MSRITIIGGHGKVALRLAPLLVSRGEEVTSVIRNPDHAEEVAATGATPQVADIETLDRAGFAELFSGVDAVVWSAGAGGGSPERTYAVDRDAATTSMDAAADAGVPRYVMVSYFGAGPDHGVPQDDAFFPYADAKSAADAHLEQSSLDWTILRPSRLTLEDGTGRIESGPGVQGGEVSRDDVAAVAAAVLADNAAIGRIIEFNDGDTPIEDVVAGR